MKDPSKKIKSESIEENSFLKKRIQELERSEIEHKLAEEELRFSRQQLRLLIDSGQDFFFLKDLDLRYQLVNIANAGFFGLDEADILGRTDFELMPDEAAVACQQSDRQAIREKRLIVMIEQVGDKFYETHKFPVIAAEEVVGVAGIIRDITDRKLAEEAIKERERLFNLTLDDMQTFVALLKPDGEIIFVNNTPLKIIGKTVEQVKGVKFYDVDWWMHSKGIQQIIKEDLRRCASGEKISCEVQIWTLDGYIWIDFSVHPIFGENGSVLYIIPEGRDITKRKQAENGLQQSEQKYRSIVENAVEGIFQSTPEGRFKTVNPAMAHMHGFASPEEMISDITHIGEQLYVNPEDRARYMKTQDEEGIVQGFETQQYRKDGSIIWASINARAVRDPTDKVLYFEGTVGDITDQKLAEDKLKESEEKYRSIFENAVEGIFQSTADRHYLNVNPAFARMHGFETPEEMIRGASSIAQQLYVYPEERQRIIEEVAEKGAVIGREAERYRKDGSKFWASLNVRAVCDSQGAALYYEGTAEDITSRKLAEEALRQSAEKLRKSLLGTIRAISSTVETRDPYTAGHQRRVSSLARVIAQEMGFPNDTVDTIRMVGSIHDIGKISVPAEILSKPGKLTDMEFGLIKIHPQSGYDILKDAELPYPIAEIVLQHHERLDGSGYPQGLKDDQILLEARIIAVADVVEAIASHRPYRPALGIPAALEEIEKNKGILYDARVVEACLQLFTEKGFKLDELR